MANFDNQNEYTQDENITNEITDDIAPQNEAVETTDNVEDSTIELIEDSDDEKTASFSITHENNSQDSGYNRQNYDYYNTQPVSYGYTAPIKKKSEAHFSFTTLIVSIIICAIVSSVVSIGGIMVANSNVTNSPTTNIVGGGTNTTITNNTDNFVEAVAEKVQPSVVGISITYSAYNFFGEQSSTDSSGSGVIYTADGYIITNKHVIDYAISRNGKISVYLPSDMEKSYDAAVVGYDSSTDLAVIKINASNLPAAEIGKSSDLKVGQNVVAVGNPGGLQFMGSVSVGYISGLNRELTIDSMQMTLIQTDTAINPGNSGGALVDDEGKLIGITNAKLVSEDFEGMGFAIPIDKVTDICDQIITGKIEGQPYIGVNINTSYTPEILEGQGFPAGAVVGSVVMNSPAHTAGIKAFDIIVSIDDKATKDYDQLVAAIKAHKVGDKMKVKIYRDSRYIELEVVVGTNN